MEDSMSTVALILFLTLENGEGGCGGGGRGGRGERLRADIVG